MFVCMNEDNDSVTSGSSTMDVDYMDGVDASQKVAARPLHHSEQIKAKKHVSFVPFSQQHNVLSRYDMTQEEISASWFDRFELRQFKTTAKSEANLLDRGLYYDSRDSCTRGLECRTQDGSRQKRQRRLNAAAAIFMELDHQEEIGMSTDDEAVADVYYNYSQPCLVAAQMIALRDHRDAVECWEQPQGQLSMLQDDKNTTTAPLASTAAIIIDQSMFSATGSSQGILASSAA
jgi:hypothetical protein